jgi:L-fucose isomerase-like protein
MDSQDVVVDSHAEVLWRLRGLYGLKNSMGKRMVAVGGASGWGAGGRKAADNAREIWKMDIRPVTYQELGERIQRARSDGNVVAKCRAEADKYLKQKGVTLQTTREFVQNSFLLTEIFRDLLDEAETDSITINQCMGTIMPISETSACLPLSILNDEGYMAFCESDFVVIPSGVLLHYVSGKPVFLNDPTYPHDGVVTLAHCTAPRRMSGDTFDPAKILTHFESDYGAAPKVEMRKGQRVTVLDPNFGGRDWVGFEGEVVDTPFLPICRSQVDIGIQGDCDALAREMKGFHWMMCYGQYLKETAYALKKGGISLKAV